MYIKTMSDGGILTWDVKMFDKYFPVVVHCLNQEAKDYLTGVLLVQGLNDRVDIRIADVGQRGCFFVLGYSKKQMKIKQLKAGPAIEKVKRSADVINWTVG